MGREGIDSIKLTDKAKKVLNRYRKNHTHRNKTESYNDLIGCFDSPTHLEKLIMEFQPTLLENIIKEHRVLEKALKATPERASEKVVKAFDYEAWYCDCSFGSYLKEKRKVFCRCAYPSVKKWLPRNRLVDPQVCADCFPRVQSIQMWIAKQEREGPFSGDLYCAFNLSRFITKEEQLKICPTCTFFRCPYHPKMKNPPPLSDAV